LLRTLDYPALTDRYAGDRLPKWRRSGRLDSPARQDLTSMIRHPSPGYRRIPRAEGLTNRASHGTSDWIVHGVASYVTLLETGYAIHELVFGILFFVIVAFLLRRGQWWAWWLPWVVRLADVGYTLTF
jgi:hypothetical protein